MNINQLRCNDKIYYPNDVKKNVIEDFFFLDGFKGRTFIYINEKLEPKTEKRKCLLALALNIAKVLVFFTIIAPIVLGILRHIGRKRLLFTAQIITPLPTDSLKRIQEQPKVNIDSSKNIISEQLISQEQPTPTVNIDSSKNVIPEQLIPQEQPTTALNIDSSKNIISEQLISQEQTNPTVNIDSSKDSKGKPNPILLFTLPHDLMNLIVSFLPDNEKIQPYKVCKSWKIINLEYRKNKYINGIKNFKSVLIKSLAKIKNAELKINSISTHRLKLSNSLTELEKNLKVICNEIYLTVRSSCEEMPFEECKKLMIDLQIQFKNFTMKAHFEKIFNKILLEAEIYKTNKYESFSDDVIKLLDKLGYENIFHILTMRHQENDIHSNDPIILSEALFRACGWKRNGQKLRINIPQELELYIKQLSPYFQEFVSLILEKNKMDPSVERNETMSTLISFFANNNKFEEVDKILLLVEEVYAFIDNQKAEEIVNYCIENKKENLIRKLFSFHNLRLAVNILIKKNQFNLAINLIKGDRLESLELKVKILSENLNVREQLGHLLKTSNERKLIKKDLIDRNLNQESLITISENDHAINYIYNHISSLANEKDSFLEIFENFLIESLSESDQYLTSIFHLITLHNNFNLAKKLMNSPLSFGKRSFICKEITTRFHALNKQNEASFFENGSFMFLK